MSEASQEFVIANALGLHARAAATLVKVTSRFRCEVEISRLRFTVNGKSILGLMTLAASRGSQIKVKCSGEDADEALAAIGACIEGRFGEE